MWQRFTERARRVVFFAQEEAASRGQRFLDTEHLLLGLIRDAEIDGGNAASQVLERLGVSFEALRSRVEKLALRMPRGDAAPGHQMELTPAVQRVIDNAYFHAHSLGNSLIGTEHLLLGLVWEDQGPVAHLLFRMKLTRDRTLDAVRELQERKSVPELPAPNPETPDLRSVRTFLRGLFRSRSEAPAPPERPESPEAPEFPEIPRALTMAIPERTRRVLSRAAREAARRGEHEAGTEDLLLALLRDPIAAIILERLQLPLAQLRQELQTQLASGGESAGLEMSWTPRARRCLDRAYEEARAANSPMIGPEHLLFALAGEEDGFLARSLPKYGADLERLRGVVRKLREPETPGPPEDASRLISELTQGALRVLVEAQRDAGRRGHAAVDTPHVLYALARTRLLTRLGADADKLREESLDRLPGPTSGKPALRFTPAVRRALFLAFCELPRVPAESVGAEHLLLGLIREGGAAAAALAASGIDEERVRAALAESASDEERESGSMGGSD